MSVDLLNDALVAIKNATFAGKQDCQIKANKLIGRILAVMQQAGYISMFEYIDAPTGSKFKIKLSGAINVCGVIKPRFAVKSKELEKFEARYLPGQDFGIIIMTTTQGVISHAQAKEIGVGGKLLAYVY